MIQSPILPKLIPDFIKVIRSKNQMKTPIMSLLLLTVPLVSAQAASFDLKDNNSEIRIDLFENCYLDWILDWP